MDIDKIVERCLENGVSDREVKEMIEQYANEKVKEELLKYDKHRDGLLGGNPEMRVEHYLKTVR